MSSGWSGKLSGPSGRDTQGCALPVQMWPIGRSQFVSSSVPGWMTASCGKLSGSPQSCPLHSAQNRPAFSRPSGMVTR